MYGLFTLHSLNKRLSDPTTRSVKDPADSFGSDFIYYQDRHCRHYWEHRTTGKVIIITYHHVQPAVNLRSATVGDLVASKGSGYEVLLFTGDIYKHSIGNKFSQYTPWIRTNTAAKVWRQDDLTIVKILAELLIDGSMDPVDIDNKYLYGIFFENDLAWQ